MADEDYQPVNRERLQKIALLLVRAAGVEKGYSDIDPAWLGAIGSQGARDRLYNGPLPDAPWGPRVISTALASCRLQLVAVVDHLLSLGRLFDSLDDDGSFTPIVIARSAIETAARAWWVIDPAITAHQRAARGCAEQLYSAHQAERLAEAMELPGGVDGISPSVDSLETEIGRLGFAVSWKNGVPTVDGERRPGATRFISEFLAHTPYAEFRKAAYPLYSAVTHGTQYGLFFAYRDEGETINGEKVLIRRIDQRHLDGAAGLSILCFTTVLRRAVRVLSWGHVAIDMYERRVARVL